jgi:CBS domain-containing protein
MTPDPVTMLESETLTSAAQHMREHDIGDVIVLDDTSGRVKGIVTDRDIVIRAVAEGRAPDEATVASVCTDGLQTIGPDAPASKAVKLMRDKAIRRLPVVEDDGRPVGIVSLGDLAERLDKDSALADISAAPPQD